MPRQRGSPSQEVSSPRRTESPPSRRSSRRTNSPQSGTEGNFGNINVSPNDQSRDSQANQDDTSDSVLPGLVVDENETRMCSWLVLTLSHRTHTQYLGFPSKLLFVRSG
jgi:hypothetical protein